MNRSWCEYLAAESDHPYDMVLSFVYRMCLFVQFHLFIVSEDAGPCSHLRLYRRGAPAKLDRRLSVSSILLNIEELLTGANLLSASCRFIGVFSFSI